MEHLLAVDDFAELADVMPGSADTVYVAGHRSPGDGGRLETSRSLWHRMIDTKPPDD